MKYFESFFFISLNSNYIWKLIFPFDKSSVKGSSRKKQKIKNVSQRYKYFCYSAKEYVTGGRQSCGESIRSAFSDCWHCPQESVAFTPKVLHVLKKYTSIYLDLFLNFLHLVCVWIRICKYFAYTMQCSILFLYFRDCTMCLWFCMESPCVDVM